MALILVSLSLLVCAQGPAGAQSDSSYLTWDLSHYPDYVIVQAYYDYTSIYSTQRTQGQGDAAAGDRFTIERKPLPGAVVRFTYDGKPLMDSAGKVLCDNLTTVERTTPVVGLHRALEVGEAVCRDIRYAESPTAPGQPLALAQWPRGGELNARIVSLVGNARVRPGAMVSQLIIPPNAGAAMISSVIRQTLLSGATYAACLPGFIILGLLLSSLIYAGKDPFALFDIITPRLPAMKKVRYKPATQPFHLAYKARLSNRIARRAEKAMATNLVRLYMQSGKSREQANAAAKAALAILPSNKDFTKRIDASTSKAEFEAMLRKLKAVVDQSGGTQKERDRVWGLMVRMAEVREALALDIAATGNARSGGTYWQAKHSKNLAARADYVGARIAKPLLLIPGVARSRWIEYVPGLPYVERVTMAFGGWLGNRAGNIAMRRDIAKTAAAEIGARMGVVDRNSAFAKKNLYDYKKIGELPLIVEALRNETYILGRAVMDEHLRAMALALMTQRGRGKDAGEGGLDLKGVAEFRAMAEAARREATDRDNRFDPIRFRQLLGDRLLKHLQQNRQIALVDAEGRELDAAERKAFLEQARTHIATAARLIREDGHATADGLLPSLNDDKAKGMDPAAVYKRYTQMTDLLKTYQSQYEKSASGGRLPMVYLGLDLADIHGRAVGRQMQEGALRNERMGDAERMLLIRLRIENDLLRKRLFEYAVGNQTLKDRYGEPLAMLEASGRFNPRYAQALADALDAANLRNSLDFYRRGEWAARNFLTAYNPFQTGYTYESERNKVEMLRQAFGREFDRGFENLFKGYALRVEHNRLLYLTLAELSPFYRGRDLTAEVYEQWKKDGVRHMDIQKGIWLVGPDRAIMPLASGVVRDPQTGRIERVLREEKDGRLAYSLSAMSNMLVSDYSERPLNAALLFRTPDGSRFKYGNPMDADTSKLLGQLRAYWGELNAPRYGQATGLSKEREGMAAGAGSVLERDMAGAGAGLSRAQVLSNIARVERMLSERMQLTTRSAVVDDKSLSAMSRAGIRFGQLIERIGAGGIHNSNERMHGWYTSQAYARVVLEAFSRQAEQFYSDETRASREAKERLGGLRREERELLGKMAPTFDETRRLEYLRTHEIPTLSRQVEQLEAKARENNRQFGGADRHTRWMKEAWVPFYNVAELTVMRDPRIAFGGGYGMSQATMVGYQTGQFVGERTMMNFGYGIGPSDRMANVLVRPTYYTAMVYGMLTRTFFTKLTGYTTIYHMDIERGVHGTSHEPEILGAFQSVFKPRLSMDWLTRAFAKPFVRKKWTDEFGTEILDESKWAGARYVSPLSWKSVVQGGAEELYRRDEDTYRLKGINAYDEVRQRKLGLSFREEFSLWDKRYAAGDIEANRRTMESLQARAAASKDPAERELLRHMAGEMRDMVETSRKIWSVPFIGNWFRQGYYAMENRSGYDMSAIGSAHRPPEMFWPYFKNMDWSAIPGMLYSTKGNYGEAGTMELFPRVTRTLAQGDGPLKKMADHLQPREVDGLGTVGNVGRDVHRDSLRDLYRRETPLLTKFVDLEMQRAGFGFLNSPYIIPLAPTYLGAYHLAKRFIPSMREKAFTIETPSERHLGPLSGQEAAQEERMRTERTRAMRQGEGTYSCPTHGITLPVGATCPLCRSTVNYEMDKYQASFARKAEKAGQWAVNAVQSAYGIHGYDHYMNQAHCPMHGIAFDRGTACPLCLERKVREETVGGGGRDRSRRMSEMREANKRLEGYTREMEKVASDRRLNEEERVRRVREIAQRREQFVADRGISSEADTRMSYEQSREQLKSEMQRVAELERRFGAKFNLN